MGIWGDFPGLTEATEGEGGGSSEKRCQATGGGTLFQTKAASFLTNPKLINAANVLQFTSC